MKSKLSLFILLAFMTMKAASAQDYDSLLQEARKQIERAKSVGVGVSSYEKLLAGIEAEKAAAAPEDKLAQRLKTLTDALNSQLSEREALKSGVRGFAVSETDRKQWGKYAPTVAMYQAKVRQCWNPPKHYKTENMIVYFRVNTKSGQPEQAKITRSSGIAAMDESLLEAVNKAAPFPVPAFHPKAEPIEVEFNFQYNVIRR